MDLAIKILDLTMKHMVICWNICDFTTEYFRHVSSLKFFVSNKSWMGFPSFFIHFSGFSFWNKPSIFVNTMGTSYFPGGYPQNSRRESQAGLHDFRPVGG